MTLKCGLVGLPNVGKSTLFNALLGCTQAVAANYPFCTIEPNIGIATLYDPRLDQISKISCSQQILYPTLQVMDIAGLVAGASKGEGMGNEFLKHIAEVDAIIHVLRCFEDPDTIHVHNIIDPIHDEAIITTELLLSDLQVLEKALISSKRNTEQVSILSAAIDEINNQQKLTYHPKLETYNLLSLKPRLYVCNVEEANLPQGNLHSARVQSMHSKEQTLVISAKIESEIAQLTSIKDQKEFLAALNLEESGINQIVKTMYKLMKLITYFTTGPKETRAWTIASNTIAPIAAGKIHSDFAKKFIRAEVINWQEFIACQGWAKARSQGKVSFEGKNYIVQDGDVLIFHHN